MTDRYDDLSDRARWFLNNFDEIDLADLCATHEASNKTREEAIDRVREALARFDGRGVIALGRVNLDIPTAGEVLDAVRAALDPPAAPAHDDGPSVREAAADDRNWDVEQGGE